MGLFSKPAAAKPKIPAPLVPGDGSDIVRPPAAVPPTVLKTAQPSIEQPVIRQTERQVYLQMLKVRIHQQLVERLDVQNLRTLPPDTVRAEVRVVIRELCRSEKGLLSGDEQERLMDDVMDE